MFKLHVVQAEHGDCLILEYATPASPRYLLIDGGPATIYQDHLRGELEKIRDDGGKLDLVMLSHVDDDHVNGLLDLMDELIEQRESGSRETIAVAALWHNTFSQTLGDDVEDRFRTLMDEAGAARDLMPFSNTADRSIRQGDELTQVAGALDIEINPEFDPRRLISVGDTPGPIELANLRLRIVGPTAENLESLRQEWDEWLEEQERRTLARDPELAERALRAADQSIPNLSSIMCLAEADGKTILLTGDGRGDHLLQGLQQANLLEPDGRFHVDILKVPHHGSVRNVTQEFFETVTADTYVICANGKHDNPDLVTLKWIVEAAREQGRTIEIFVTNATDSTRQIATERDPDDYGYRLAEMEPGAHAMILDLTAQDHSVPHPPDTTPHVQLTSTQGGVTMSRKALLVGINNFTQPSWRLRGCINDTIAMQGALTTYFGFEDQDIRVLHDGDATAQGIRDGLEWLLSGYAGDGRDVRVFHFSSHGTQVDDQSEDEWECLDEVIVPYDHDWSTPFRDDDLRAIFDTIPEGVNFTFIADCCHSGTIQKVLFDVGVEFRPRYLSPPLEVQDRILARQAQRDAEADAWAAAQLAQMLQDIPQDQWAAKMQEYLALLRRRFRENKYGVVPVERHVLLAGCEDRQTAADAHIEGEYRGAFTWALSQAIKDANGDLTYDELITRAGANLREYAQRPQLECPSEMRDLKVFGPLVSE
ncbi:MAG: caspase family protein [Anaerolineae bacterium]